MINMWIEFGGYLLAIVMLILAATAILVAYHAIMDEPDVPKENEESDENDDRE